MKKNLVIYYSRKDENYFGGELRYLKKGNTEYVAEFIRDAADADIFEIKTVKNYPKDYKTCTEVANDELKRGDRPELQSYLDGIDQYENIFVCGPCWWGTYPMAILTQLERLNFEGKNIFPVMTHEGSGLGESRQTLEKICKNAKVHEGLAVLGSEAENSKNTVINWLKNVMN